MKLFERGFVFAIAAMFLLSCTSGGVGGGGEAGGPVGGTVGGTEQASVDQEAIPKGPVPQVIAQAAGDGTLGSQSSNADLTPKFIREFTLFFAGETPAQRGAEFSYVLPNNPGALPAAEVKKIQSSGPQYSETACASCAGRWVRAVNCGAYTDQDIEALVPPEQKANPVTQIPLLWYILSLPRASMPNANSVCESAKYRDFAVKTGGSVDLGDLDLYPNEIVVFYLLEANPADDLGPLSTSGYGQISKEGIAATAKRGLIRYTRPTSAMKLQLQPIIQVLPGH